jgi:PAS domain S-box-containing protein
VPPGAGLGNPEDPRRLLHELQVHQVELELQNLELLASRNRAEALLRKYAELYDFAPVGYFSVDERGRIVEVNQTGAGLLGIPQARLRRRTLAAFVAPAARPAFRAFLQQVLGGAGEQAWEAPLASGKGPGRWANFHAAATGTAGDTRRTVRLAISDITVLKRAQDAQHRLEALAATNQALEQEIARRREVETGLLASEQRQLGLLEQSRHMQEQLRSLSRQILQAQEEERKRISRELHDQITQTLVGINIQLATLTHQPELDPRALGRKIVRTRRLVEKAVRIVSQFARELRPAALDDLGLTTTLHSLLKEFAKRTGVHAHLTSFAGVERLNSDQRTVLYRVAQSALTNVARHAHATRVEVHIRKAGRAVLLEVQDNGCSFDVDRVLHARQPRRLGLLGMRERVAMVGGRLEVTSAPSRGTTIRACIPLSPPGPVRAPTSPTRPAPPQP